MIRCALDRHLPVQRLPLDVEGAGYDVLPISVLSGGILDLLILVPVMAAKIRDTGHKADAWGLGREGCVVFGDGGNDIDMLDYAGIGVANGECAFLVKSHADYVT